MLNKIIVLKESIIKDGTCFLFNPPSPFKNQLQQQSQQQQQQL